MPNPYFRHLRQHHHIIMQNPQPSQHQSKTMQKNESTKIQVKIQIMCLHTCPQHLSIFQDPMSYRLTRILALFMAIRGLWTFWKIQMCQLPSEEYLSLFRHIGQLYLAGKTFPGNNQVTQLQSAHHLLIHEQEYFLTSTTRIGTANIILVSLIQIVETRNKLPLEIRPRRDARKKWCHPKQFLL